MAHPEQQNFILSVKQLFPSNFSDVRVLDVGSLDINGNNRIFFDSTCHYLGLDIGFGKNVDVVCRCHEFKDTHGFDTIISTECFEHDEFWTESIKNIINLLKSDGLFVFSCAADGRQEHGTQRTSPQDSPFTCAINDYYHNLSKEEFEEKIEPKKYFSKFSIEQIKTWPQDLYFWGIKK